MIIKFNDSEKDLIKSVIKIKLKILVKTAVMKMEEPVVAALKNLNGLRRILQFLINLSISKIIILQ